MQPVVRPAPILGHFLACSSFFGGLRSFGFRVQGLASFLLVAFDIAVVASRLKLVRLTATRETKRERERASWSSPWRPGPNTQKSNLAINREGPHKIKRVSPPEACYPHDCYNRLEAQEAPKPKPRCQAPGKARTTRAQIRNRKPQEETQGQKAEMWIQNRKRARKHKRERERERGRNPQIET